MHNAAGNDYQWIFYHPGNVKFLQEIENKLNTQVWLKPQKQAHSINNHKYKLEVEHNLMKVLHMGNYFGSCLSVGEFNDFSTIANAVEINKHVIWMKNKQDKIIGRKLIVIDKKLRLYGFNSYGAALGGNRENHWVKILFDLYCLELARTTGTIISNERDEESLNLFARWYDDGTEGFDWWVIELSEGVHLQDIAKKLIYNPDSPYNLRAALWCDFSGLEISNEWNNLHAFQEARAKIKN